jgi:hypothetical protein
VHTDTIQKKLYRRGHMTMLENTIDADTEALQMFAKDFSNVGVAYKSYGDTSPFRWEVPLRDPPSYLGTIELTAPEISLAEPERRKLLRLKFLRIL